MKFTQLLVLAGILFVANGCFPDNELPNYSEIEGVVLDANGDPIPEANIHIRNHFNPGGFRINENAGTAVTVSFDVNTEDVYTAVLFHHGADSAFAQFFEDTLQTGRHTLTIPDSLLTNGVFGYEVRSDLASLGANLFLINKPDSLLVGTRPFTQTYFRGEFTLNPDYLALGRTFNVAGSGRFDITDSLQIMVEMDGEIAHTEEVRVKPDRSNFFEITVD